MVLMVTIPLEHSLVAAAYSVTAPGGNTRHHRQLQQRQQSSFRTRWRELKMEGLPLITMDLVVLGVFMDLMPDFGRIYLDILIKKPDINAPEGNLTRETTETIIGVEVLTRTPDIMFLQVLIKTTLMELGSGSRQSYNK